jgi:hypothetical protein
MKWLRLLVCLGGYLVLPLSFLSSQEPACFFSPLTAPAEDCAPPSVPEQSVADPLPASATATESSPFVFFPPGMFGDLLEIEVVRQSVGNRLEVISPVAFRSSFTISDNESPRPLDRVFVTGHYFNGVARSFLAPNGAFSASVYREMIGFEKTFLQGNASVGMRLPFFQLTDAPGLNETRIGDVSVLLKYAFINDRASGDVFSGGLVITAPTGPALHFTGQSAINPLILQPWLGDLWNWKNLFVQGFTSVAVPTDTRDVILFFKSVGIGYCLYRCDEPNRLLNAIVPEAELHLTTPLNHKGLNTFPIGFPSILDFTGGFYFFLRETVLGVGVGAPLTGPKPYEYQVMANLNVRF